jgi:hypothetical protein
MDGDTTGMGESPDATVLFFIRAAPVFPCAPMTIIIAIQERNNNTIVGVQSFRILIVTMVTTTAGFLSSGTNETTRAIFMDRQALTQLRPYVIWFLYSTRSALCLSSAQSFNDGCGVACGLDVVIGS